MHKTNWKTKTTASAAFSTLTSASFLFVQPCPWKMASAWEAAHSLEASAHSQDSARRRAMRKASVVWRFHGHIRHCPNTCFEPWRGAWKTWLITRIAECSRTFPIRCSSKRIRLSVKTDDSPACLQLIQTLILAYSQNRQSSWLTAKAVILAYS